MCVCVTVPRSVCVHHTCVCVHMYSLILFFFLLRYVSLQRLIIASAGDHITLPSNVTDLLSIMHVYARTV